jgi:hypothetical protein
MSWKSKFLGLLGLEETKKAHSASAVQTQPAHKKEIQIQVRFRYGEQHTLMSCEWDKPESAFEMALHKIMGRWMEYESVSGVRVDSNGEREIIFNIRYGGMNISDGTHDFDPSFPGSWQPPEALRETVKIPT